MPCAPAVAKRTSTGLPVLGPGLLLFSFRLWRHLDGNRITLSPPLSGSFGSRTNHTLTEEWFAPLPPSPYLTAPPGCRQERLTRSRQLSRADMDPVVWTRWLIYWTLPTTRSLCFCFVFSLHTQVPSPPGCFLLLIPIDLCCWVVMKVLILL